MNCTYPEYRDLEPTRESFRTRVKQSKHLKNLLTLLFKVPTIETDNWMQQAYAEPDKVFMHNFVIGEFIQQNRQRETNQPCKEEGCQKHALRLSVHCLSHHIMSLQNVGRLPPSPTGRLLGNLSLVSF